MFYHFSHSFNAGYLRWGKEEPWQCQPTLKLLLRTHSTIVDSVLIIFNITNWLKSTALCVKINTSMHRRRTNEHAEPNAWEQLYTWTGKHNILQKFLHVIQCVCMRVCVWRGADTGQVLKDVHSQDKQDPVRENKQGWAVTQSRATAARDTSK